jgi:hypothetical protein
MTWMDIIDMNRKKLSYLGKVSNSNDTNTSKQIQDVLEEINSEKVKSRLSINKTPEYQEASQVQTPTSRVF